MDEPEICPHCGSRNLAQIVYGLLTEEGYEQLVESGDEMGGCCVAPESPLARCRDCGRAIGRWDELHQRS